MNDAHIVVDLGFGDAGKGATVDALVEWNGAGTVVRFNGGAQAGHNVVLSDGRHHTFAQFGAASFIPGVRTLLSRFVVLHPTGLLAEADQLARVGVSDALQRLDVDRDAVVSSPYHQAAGRLRELARGQSRHGSCGVGHGEAVAWSLAEPSTTLTVGALDDVAAVTRCLGAQRQAAAALLGDVASLAGLPAYDAARALVEDDHLFRNAIDLFSGLGARLNRVDGAALRRALQRSSVVFEGAQGVLLDEHHGFHPHTTWSTTTATQAHTLLDEASFSGRRVVLGVSRTYSVRHGAGPFPAEDAAMRFAEPHNAEHAWQGQFRAGPLDGVLLRYALAAMGQVDSLVLTHADRATPEWVTGWDTQGLDPALAHRFERRHDQLVALRPLATPDLEAQAALGAFLATRRPIREPMPSPAALAERLRLPLACVSYGPARTDRRWTGQGL